MQSAFAKLNRGKSHRDGLRTDIEAFRSRNPHDWVVQQTSYRDGQNRLTISIVVKVNEENPDIWPVMIGDILTNLRAALDHSIFGHAASRTVLKPHQERDMHFPILTDSTKWPGIQSKLAPLLDPAVLAVVEQSQPFHHPQQDGGPAWHPLAVLNGLVIPQMSFRGT